MKMMALANCRATIFISVTASLSKICGKAQRRHHLFMPSQYLLAAESHAPRCPVEACSPVAQRSKACGRLDRASLRHAAPDTPALRVGTLKAVAIASPTTSTTPFNIFWLRFDSSILSHLECGGGSINSVKRIVLSVAKFASFDRVYTSSSALQCERIDPRGASFLKFVGH